ncbi:hypothetical protein [Thauera sp. Sel9]|uniref:hypothetical protein n=1 Tax=Thauera sp. Sel9 TaxID=2974299 RepID=UPI0021E11E4A|nr:hypothetical protein [Thauera sp. Sel9]MCV2216130.1 hypothetical protein [Thauera sp. Sel9]
MRQAVLDQLLPAAIMRLHREGYLPKGIANLLNCPVAVAEDVIQRRFAQQVQVMRPENPMVDTKVLVKARKDEERTRAREQKRLEHVARIEAERALRQAVVKARQEERERLREEQKERSRLAKEAQRALANERQAQEARARPTQLEQILDYRAQGLSQKETAEILGVDYWFVHRVLMKHELACIGVRVQPKRKPRPKREQKPKQVVRPKQVLATTSNTPCPKCHSTHTAKFGTRPVKHSAMVIQRFICRGCGERFSENANKWHYGDHRPDLTQPILRATLAGKTHEGMVAEFQCGGETIPRKIRRMAEHARKHHVAFTCTDQAAWLTAITTGTEMKSAKSDFLYLVVGAETGEVLEFNFSRQLTHRHLDTLADVARISYPGLTITQTPPEDGPAQATVAALTEFSDKALKKVRNIQSAGERMYLWMGDRRGLFQD